MTANQKIVPSLMLSCAAIWSGCSSANSATKPPMPTVPVTVAAVEVRTVPLQYRGIGNVEPFSKVEIKSQVAASLEQVHFKEGEDVKQGQLLFVLDRRQLEADLNRAEATLNKDSASATNAKTQAARAEKLLQEGVMAREQYDQIVSESAAQDASVEADRAAVRNAKVQLAYTEIRAPISGRTGNLMVYAGNIVKANETVLVTINQVTPVFVTFSVPESFLAEVKKFSAQGKLPVQATPQGQRTPESGSLSFIDNGVDPQTGTIKLKATFANEKRTLWPGQFADVTLTLNEEADRIVVPSQAVQTGQAGTFVFVVKPDMSVESRPVKVLRTNERDAIIAEGLKNGETVVTDGQLMLFPGVKVDIKKNGEVKTPPSGF